MRRFSLAVFLILLAFGCGSASAQTVPDDELSRRFAVRIGAPWKVQAFVVDATANYGTAVEPVVKSRFHADLKLTADTFVVAERQGSATFLARVSKEGEVRTVFGVATAVLRGGGWQVEFDPQNDPVAGSGLPRTAFPGRLVVRGTDEEAIYFKEIAATAAAAQARVLEEQAAVARTARERQALEATAREEALQIAAKEAAAEAVAAQKRAEEAATADAAAQARLTEQLKSLSESLRASLTVSLSQGWLPTAVTVLGTVNTGTAAEPEIQSRFTASLQLASDRFVEKDTAPGVTIISRVLAAGETRTLSGTGVSSLINGAWKSVAKLDAEPQTGQPRDSFNGHVILARSGDEDALRREQEQEAERKHSAEMARQARLLDEQAAVAKVAKERQAQDAVLREEAEQIAEREATAAAAATLKRLQELDTALADTDPKRRRVALDKALKSSDPMVQNMALRDLFSRVKIFTVMLEGNVEGRTVLANENLEIDRFDKQTGQISMNYGNSKGRLTGVTIGIEDRMLVSLVGDTLQGRYQRGDRTWWKATIKLQ